MPKKLGIRHDSRVLLDGAPAGFELEGVEVRRRLGGPPFDIAVVFCPDYATLAKRWPVVHPAVTQEGRLWVAWPKKASGVPTDLNDNVVREYGLAHGRVDVKVCAIDLTWSGAAFVVRLKDRG